MNNKPWKRNDGRIKVFVGMQFGKLKIVGQLIERKHKERQFLCKCECGNSTILPAYAVHTGATKSCGCIYRKHGLHRHHIYGCWRGMIKRCYQQTHHSYHQYGEKGVTVCERWRASFKLFLEDMGMPPSNKHSIDRINNDGNYEPSNCRWATASEQCNNRRDNILLTYNGTTKTQAQWAEHLGIPSYIIYGRRKRNLSIEEVLFAPYIPKKKGAIK